MISFSNKVQQTISIEWWCTDESVEMKDYFESQLMEHAQDHIGGMVDSGYTSGELNFSISGDGVDFRGSWEVEETEEEPQEETDKQVVALAVAQVIDDVNNGDVTALYELFGKIPQDVLRGYCNEEDLLKLN